MPEITIDRIEVDPKTGRIDVHAGPFTYHFGDRGVLDHWLATNRKECDACLRAAMKDVLAADPTLSSVKTYEATRYVVAAEPALTKERA